MTDGLFSFGNLETVEVDRNGPGCSNDSIPKAPVGILLRFQGNLYRYVKYVDATDETFATDALYWYALDPINGVFEVGGNPALAIGLRNSVAGVATIPFPGVPTNHYMFVQVGGIVEVTIDGGAKGDLAVGSAIPWALADVAAGVQPPYHVYGVLVEDFNLSKGSAKILLQNLHW